MSWVSRRLSRARVRDAVLVGAALAVTSLAGGAVAQEGSETIVIEFSKAFDPDATDFNGTPTWTGTTTDGDPVEVRLVDFRQSGNVQHLVVDFDVATDGGSFTARLAGVFNESTERTALNGTITSTGWMHGAQVHEEGERTDESTSSFVGTVTVMPSS